VIVGSYAYTVSNFGGAIYKVDIYTGEYQTFVTGLDYPEDIEFVRITP